MSDKYKNYKNIDADTLEDSVAGAFNDYLELNLEKDDPTEVSAARKAYLFWRKELHKTRKEEEMQKQTEYLEKELKETRKQTQESKIKTSLLNTRTKNHRILVQAYLVIGIFLIFSPLVTIFPEPVTNTSYYYLIPSGAFIALVYIGYLFSQVESEN